MLITGTGFAPAGDLSSSSAWYQWGLATSGLKRACAECARLRVDGRWTEMVLPYHHLRHDVSHGICPRCSARLYPGMGE